MKQFAAGDYESRGVEAARRVLPELTRVLGDYEEEIAIVDGWVPPGANARMYSSIALRQGIG